MTYFEYTATNRLSKVIDAQGNQTALVMPISIAAGGEEEIPEEEILEEVYAPYGFTGEAHDLYNGLIYLRARYYDPTVGSFISQDSYPGELNNPLSQNRYTYVQNNPINFVDPSGHYMVIRDIDAYIDSPISNGLIIEDIAADSPLGTAEKGVYGNPENVAWLYNDKKACGTSIVDTGNGNELILPDEVRGIINGREKVLNPNNNWAAYEYLKKPGETGKTDEGKYKIAVGPKVLDPNYPDDGKIWNDDFSGLNKNIDVVLVNKTTGETLTLKCYVTDIKAHTYNSYNGGGNNVSFDIESGFIQTGIAYPNSWNYSHETPFSEKNCDASVIEFIIKPTDFKPNNYRLCKIITYN